MTRSRHAVAPKVVVEFLARTLPFNELDSSTLEDLAQQWDIEYYPKGTLIFQQGVTEVTHLCLIQKGGIKVYFKDSEPDTALKDYRGEGAAFGALSIVRGEKAALNVEAVEDTFCFLLEKESFLRLVQHDGRVARFYLQGFSEDFVSAAYSELRSEKVKLRDPEALHLFSSGVSDIIRIQPQMILSSASIQEAAMRMAELGIGSLLVRGPNNGLVGIVTDKDLRTKVVARGLDYREPVEKIMSAPVHTIPAGALCFDALLEIMTKGVNHLVVEQEREIMGVLSSHDITVYKGVWTIYLFRRILAERTFSGLYGFAEKVPMAVRTLIEEGARGGSVARVITMLNDCLLDRVLGMLLEEMGPPPVPFCWLKLGSDGRREQTFRTDQDNAIVYRDPEDPRDLPEAEAYFEALAMQAISHLEGCGYPRCKSEIMASNRRWCKPMSVWLTYFDEWVSTPDPQEASFATIFFDLRAGFGEFGLGKILRKRITALAERQHVFLMHLAGDCMLAAPPLSFFRDFLVERTGEYSNRLDLKGRCVAPFVNFARVMALKHGIDETNTMDRLQLLAERGRIPMDLYADAREAYEFGFQLGLVHQLRMAESGRNPDTYVDPADLSDIERKALKESFAVLNRVLALIKQEFPAVF